jgi:hypothetical protein
MRRRRGVGEFRMAVNSCVGWLCNRLAQQTRAQARMPPDADVTHSTSEASAPSVRVFPGSAGAAAERRVACAACAQQPSVGWWGPPTLQHAPNTTVCRRQRPPQLLFTALQEATQTLIHTPVIRAPGERSRGCKAQDTSSRATARAWWRAAPPQFAVALAGHGHAPAGSAVQPSIAACAGSPVQPAPRAGQVTQRPGRARRWGAGPGAASSEVSKSVCLSSSTQWSPIPE